MQKASKGAVINFDCINSKPLTTKNKNIVTFSVKNPDADIYLSNIKPLADGIAYRFDNQQYKLQLTGAFNVANAACVLSVCKLLNLDLHQVASCLAQFLGTKRRLDIIGTKNNITVIDDFAHNPDKVAASMSALKDYEGRLLLMFQPHGFSPMRMMGKAIMESFAKFMQKDDILFIPEIFYAGGSVKKDISSNDLVNYAKSLNVNANFYQSRDEIKAQIVKIAKPYDRIVIMGARDNSLPDFCADILKEL